MPSTPAETMPAVAATLPASASLPLTRDEQILHVLNRFTYGPRPGDLERVRAEGLTQWFSQQLNPFHIDDSALDRRLADYPAMQLTVAKMIELYPNGQMARAQLDGKVGRPRGEAEKAIYDAANDRTKERAKDRKNKDAAANLAAPPSLPMEPAAYLGLDAKDRFNELCRLTPLQLRTLRQRLPADQRDQLTQDFTPRQLEELAAISGPERLVATELVQTKLLRDIYSERQLNEIMTDFWLNHFNVYVRKSGEAPYLIESFERDTIRPRALGHFENLLVATAISPAMLDYLDNAQSIGPNSRWVEYQKYLRMRGPAGKEKTGLNENYAREIMELHTLGVNGGYTQKDVTEVAKVFTGWTLGRAVGDSAGPEVHPGFDPTKHEPGPKTVLGVTIKENGLKEGMQVLHMLATSPQTAHFICTKLAVRFVSDDPPPALVTRMTVAFLQTNGDIRRVLLAMVNSPGFFSRATYRAKVKTPQDYVVSAVRASGAEVVSAGSLAAVLEELGMPLYGMQTPNGYSMRADAWNNTAELISRMNFALALSSNRVSGVQADLPALIAAAASPSGLQGPAAPGQLGSRPDPAQTDSALEDKLLHMPVSDRTRRTILAQISAPPSEQQASLRQISARNGGRDLLTTLRPRTPQDVRAPIPDPEVALGSPEFQRR
jgi:uncharacterized protein (DUF1800 family)